MRSIKNSAGKGKIIVKDISRFQKNRIAFNFTQWWEKLYRMPNLMHNLMPFSSFLKKLNQ